VEAVNCCLKVINWFSDISFSSTAKWQSKALCPDTHTHTHTHT